MALKKKVIAGTIAASLTFTALAGLPLSDKGIAEKLGFSVAYAQSTQFPIPQVVTWANAVKQSIAGAVYAPHVADNIDVKLGNSSVASITYTVYGDPSTTQTVYTVQEITEPVVGKLNLDSDDRDNVDKLFAGIAKFALDQDTYALEALREDEGIRDALRNISTDITLNDLSTFLFDPSTGLQAVVNNKLNSKTPTELATLATDVAARNAFIDEIFTAILNGTNNSKIRDVLNDNGILGSDFKQVFLNFRHAVGESNFDKAAVELYLAYQNAAGIVGYTPGTGTGTPTPTTDSIIVTLVSDLTSLKTQIAAATGDEKQKLIDQAVSKANTAIEKLVSIDASKLVSTVNGKATVALSAADVTKLLSGVSDAKKALADATGSAEGLKVGAITLDLGTITQSGASVSLPQELWTLASDIKADGVAVKIGPMSATLPTGTFTEAVTLGVAVEATDATSASSSVYGKSVVSDVYNVDLEVGGKAVHEFNKPIKLRLPLKNLTGVDKELLSVARYEDDGSVSIQGGNVDGDFINEDRYKLSKYVVIENKVTFNDIARVEGWAGRQIQVVAAKGAIEGKSAGIFAPQDKITRAEFAKILITALNLDNTLATSSKFSDVPASHWAAPYIAVAAEKGIINGKSASTFAPNATITRAEMATMIARALKVTQDLKDIDNVEAALSVFKDSSKIGSAFRSSVAWAAASDIIIGANGKFLPNDNATRAEAAVIIYRAINFKPQA
ncbi:S-layer homology domain-containing protein [Cohnella sp. GCM10012308]|uniref:S-layer homology domain-containing protein n=1 Tax=Cohnella sp. GCM10012308 TaxID=3317329 RepID=UPI00360C46C8